MSATFRLAAKKKATQDELRRLMAQQKSSKNTPKINNPLAKYNDSGQLMCILCKTIVRSEHVWQVHINAKQHKENVAEAKKFKELTNNFTSTTKLKNQKRNLMPPPDAPPEKKLKGILKNSKVLPKARNNAPNVISYHNEEIKRVQSSDIKTDGANDDPSKSSQSESESKDILPSEPIPEGFFDDPILDAKARNTEYKDPIEEEWDKFQKEIREEASASAEIIAGEQEEATAERQIDEIDEQIRNWSRYVLVKSLLLYLNTY